MRYLSLLAVASTIVLAAPASAQKPGQTIVVTSPDGSVTARFAVGAGGVPHYAVSYKGQTVLRESPLGLDLAGNDALDRALVVDSVARASRQATWENPVGARRTIPDSYNEATIALRESRPPARRLTVSLRAYNEGVAFRYQLPRQANLTSFTIAEERTGFSFPSGALGWVLNMGRFNTHNEGEYTRTALDAIKPTAVLNLPLLVEIPNGPWACVLEADLTNYPGMYVGGVAHGDGSLVAKLSVPPSRKAEEAVIGSTPFVTPWRVIMVAATPGQLIEHNYLTLNLSTPSSGDFSWVRPGKAAWDWWSGSFARGVDFEPGMNTATMKHYIDFAAAHRIEYMLVDAGWYKESTDREQGNLLEFFPQVNIPDIIAYGTSKGVGVLLWVEWRTFNRQLDEATALFERWGAAGVKVDYMNRDDQEMVQLYEKWVKKAAEHHLTVDYHGAYKPTGLRRTYPNLLTREGVMGMEYNKWSERVTPEYDVTIPFTRMLAGPMDFTPGGFRNAARGKFQVKDVEPMTQGTRAHQLAMYVVYESPLVMLADYPEAYEGPGLEFIEKVPTVWDDTRVLDGAPGKYVVIARRKGDTWYIGAMTNWEPRYLSVPLSFLGTGSFELQEIADGPRADVDGTSIRTNTRRVTPRDSVPLQLGPGGGAAIVLRPSR